MGVEYDANVGVDVTGYEIAYITGDGLEGDIEPPGFGIRDSELGISDSATEGASE